MTTIPGNNYSYTAEDLYQPVTSLIVREPTAISTDIFPDAVSYILGFYGIQTADNNGQSNTVSISNNSSFNITINSNTGLTFSNSAPNDTILPNAIKTYTFNQTSTTTVIVFISGATQQIQNNTNNTVVTEGTSLSIGNDPSSTTSQSSVMETWTSGSLDTTKSWASVCFGNSQFVAVSSSGGSTAGLVRTSPDGVTWTSRTAASVNQWSSIFYAEDLLQYIAVSSTGGANTNVMYSSDGITWSAAGVTLAAGAYTCVCRTTGLQSGDVYVIANNSGATTTTQIYTSITANGSWTPRALLSATNPGWSACCWCPTLTLFIVVATGGTTSTQILTTSDFTAWTARTSPSARQWRSVCCSDTIIVAVSSDGTAAQQIMTSTDGITWTARTSPSVQQWQSVCWSRSYGMFVAVANNGTASQQVMFSTNGITWFLATSSLGVAWKAIAYGNNKFVAVAASTGLSNNAMYTTIPPDFNTDVTIGSVGTSTVITQGANVIIYPVPFYYAEKTNALSVSTGLLLPTTDITIFDVPNGRYLVQIWMLSLLKTNTGATVNITIVGSTQGIIYRLAPITPISFIGTAGGAAVGTGTKYFQFAVYSNSTSGRQNISYTISSSASGTVFTAGWLRTMTLIRIG